MRFNGISNWPQERDQVTYHHVWYDGVFNHFECDGVAAYCARQPMKEGTTLGKTKKKARVSNVSFIARNSENDWIFDRINNFVWNANTRYYGFEINGFEHLQYTEYYSTKAGKYDWHMDLCLDSYVMPQPRKLSMTLLLNNDFKGGDFQFNLGNEAEAKSAESAKGRAIFFPSWMIHRVKPVTEGTRRSLVAWVTGPKFS